MGHTQQMAEAASQLFSGRADEVLVLSTGVIGVPLPIDIILSGIEKAGRQTSPGAWQDLAQAIMTTDSFPKISSFTGRAGEHTYRIVGIAKGAGMIMPDMATMLCFILSDININSDDLKSALLSSVETTFNRISVDGDTSTNDTVLAMANGLAGNKDLSGEDHDIFAEGLRNVMWDLARMIVRDGEGATKLVSVEVKNSFSPSDALRAVRTVANSSLVKTALYGQDPNWEHGTTI